MSDSTWKLVVASYLEKLNTTLPTHIREVDKHEPAFGHVPPRGQSICKLINPSNTPQMSDLHRLVRPAPPSDRVSCSEKNPICTIGRPQSARLLRFMKRLRICSAVSLRFHVGRRHMVAIAPAYALYHSGSYRFGSYEKISIGRGDAFAQRRLRAPAELRQLRHIK